MNIKNIRIKISAVLIGLSSIAASAVDKRPNIVFILADDLGYSDMVFNQHPDAGVDDIITPNIDQLASDGTIFTSAYAVHPFCGPSRAGLMTGRYPHVIGSQFNMACYTEDGIDVNETFVSKTLHDAGYFTGIMGKWHLGETPEYHPNSRGFDEFYGFLGGGHRYFSDDFEKVATFEKSLPKKDTYDYNDPLKYNRDYAEELAGNQYLTDVLTNEGVKFLNKAKVKEQPFFLWMSYNAPHTWLEAKDSDIKELKAAPYNLKFRDKKRVTYSAMIYALDKQVKVLVDELKALGQYENTLIVFMSDNGGKGPSPVVAHAPNYPLKGKKGDVHEGGYRVPMFMHWPKGMVNAPTKYDYVVSGLDLYPTFAKLANAKLPKGKILDGKDIMKSVLKNTDVREDESLFALRVNSPSNRVAARKGQWKAKTEGDGKWELYDLSNDLKEEHPISNNQAKLDELIADAKAWTTTHVTPRWFDDEKRYGFEKKWDETSMPNWKRTFPVASSLWQDETLQLHVFAQDGMLNVEIASVLSDKVDVAIFNTQGQVVEVFTGLDVDSPNTFSMVSSENLIQGNYILKVKSGEQLFSTSFVM